MSDISLRAISVLSEVDFVLCEDTRHTKLLLDKHKIPFRQLISFHAKTSINKVQEIIKRLKAGETWAMVSDAWTPWISDPAHTLTSRCIIANVKVSPIPWACAFLAALQASWCPINAFTYLGFIPTKKWRETFLSSLNNYNHTVVFYESVHRFKKCLEQLKYHMWENRYIVVAREITKTFEEFFRWSIEEAIKHFVTVKWEFVIILPPLNFKPYEIL